LLAGPNDRDSSSAIFHIGLRRQIRSNPPLHFLTCNTMMSIFYYIYSVSLLLVSTLYSFFLSWFLCYFPCTKIWARLILPGNKCKWNFNTTAYAQLSLLVFHYFLSEIRPTLVEF